MHTNPGETPETAPLSHDELYNTAPDTEADA
jgi:hypothetical protein